MKPPLPFAVLLFALAVLLPACRKPATVRVQGYIEGEFVHVAAPSGGQLVGLAVARGDQVATGAPLFQLDPTAEQAARDEAAHHVAQAMAILADAKTGQRPPELAAIQAELDGAKAALAFSSSELARQTKVRGSGASAERDLESATAQHQRDQQKILNLTAMLETARLGSREGQVRAAEELLRAQQAALAGAEWRLAQKAQGCPLAAQVTEIVFRPGEWVNPGSPVVVLLPPGNVKAHAFVPQAMLGRIQVGASARVFVDGAPQPLLAKVSYIAPRAQYTPPVIYSQQMREKLVFLVELAFPPAVAATLHPAQPIDVEFE